MKKTLLFVLALIAAGCGPAEQSETPPEGSEQVTPSASCADITVLSSLEDVRTCAEQGDARVQTDLGFMYANGDGVPQDDVEAVRWFRLAAEQGYGDAQLNLAVMYELGEGVPQDYVLAYMWVNLAVAQGNEAAQNLKDRVEQRMTREQISEAQRLSIEWLAEHGN